MIYLLHTRLCFPEWDLYDLRDLDYVLPGWDLYDLHDLHTFAYCDL